MVPKTTRRKRNNKIMAPPFTIVEAHERALPPFLSTHRLSDVAPLGTPRFTPKDESELLPAIFTAWNLLDAHMYTKEPSASFQTGYLRELQVRRMVQLIRQPHVKTYCEIGMNGGHSLTAMLLANPTLQAYTFDLFKWKYSWATARLLNTSYPDRVEFHPGWSHQTLPPWTERMRAENRTCDVMLVDGGHTFRAARADLEELNSVANAQTRVVTDDIGMPPGFAIKVLNRTGLIRIEERYGPYPRKSRYSPCMRAPPKVQANGRLCPPWGFAVSRYLRPGERVVKSSR